MELKIRVTRDKLDTSRVCLKEVAVVESGPNRMQALGVSRIYRYI
jgi:hypothetical protein